MAKRATARKGTDHLGAAVTALTTNQPYMAVRDDALNALVNDPRGPLVEFNEQVRDGDKIAWRATALGAPLGTRWGRCGAPREDMPQPPVTGRGGPAETVRFEP